MKNKFPLYYRPSADEKKELFNDDSCYFVFDTNALLDLYRIGRDTAEKVLQLIDKYRNRIVIPFHVAEEYHNDLLDVITKWIASYDAVLNSHDNSTILQQLCETLKLNELPTIKEKFKDLISDSLDTFYQNIEEERDYLKEQFRNWELQGKISASLGSNILEGLSAEEISDIEANGQERYEQKTPPGYMDATKTENKYGDLIIWQEILGFAQGKNCSIIFISRDLKEDWILRKNGMDCGPRHELLKEFNEYSEGTFLVCSLDKFLEYANQEQNVMNAEDMQKVVNALAWSKLLSKPRLKMEYTVKAKAKDNVKLTDDDISSGTDFSSPSNDLKGPKSREVAEY